MIFPVVKTLVRMTSDEDWNKKKIIVEKWTNLYTDRVCVNERIQSRSISHGVCIVLFHKHSSWNLHIC